MSIWAAGDCLLPIAFLDRCTIPVCLYILAKFEEILEYQRTMGSRLPVPLQRPERPLNNRIARRLEPPQLRLPTPLHIADTASTAAGGGSQNVIRALAVVIMTRNALLEVGSRGVGCHGRKTPFEREGRGGSTP